MRTFWLLSPTIRNAAWSQFSRTVCVVATHASHPPPLLPHPPASQSHPPQLVLHKVTVSCTTSAPQAFVSFSVGQDSRMICSLILMILYSCNKWLCQWKYNWYKTTNNTLQGHISCSVHRPPMSVLWCSVWRLRAVWPIWWQDKALPSLPPPLISTCFGQPAGDVETVNSPGQYHFVVFCNNVCLNTIHDNCIAKRTNNRLKLFRLFWRLEFKAADSSSSSSSCRYRINIKKSSCRWCFSLYKSALLVLAGQCSKRIVTVNILYFFLEF